MIVYTRFNCRHFCIEKTQPQPLHPEDTGRAIRRMNRFRFEEKWLRERLELFKTFTIPSINQQTDQEFLWVGIAHPDSPTWFLDELSAISRMSLQLHEWDIDAKELGHTTVNLDSDDALSRDFIYETKKIQFQGETLFLRGMRYRLLTGCWISTKAPNSHFNIVQHPKMTVLDFSHGMGPLNKNIIDLKKPMWLEVIHERNIANRIKTAKKDKNLGAAYAGKFFDLKFGCFKELGYGRLNNGERR